MAQAYNLSANLYIHNVVGLSAAVKRTQRAFNSINISPNIGKGLIANLNSAVNANANLSKGLSGIGSQMGTLISQARLLSQTLGNIKTPAMSSGPFSPGAQNQIRSSTMLIGKWSAAIATLHTVMRLGRNFLDFEREMTRFQQVANLSEIAARRFGDTISKLSATSGADRLGLSQGATTLLQAGFSQRQIRGVLPTLADASLGANFKDIKQITEAMIALKGTFPELVKNNEDYARVLNQVSSLSAEYASESSDLIKVVQRSGAAFKTAGGSLNEMFALMNTLRDRTRQSSSVLANSIKSLSGRFIQPDNVRLLRSLNIELSEGGKLKGPVKVIEELADRLKKMDAQERQSIITRLAGIYQFTALATAIENVSLTREGLATIETAGQRVTQESLIQQKSLGGQIDKTRASIEDLIYQFANTSGVRRFTMDILSSTQALTQMTETLLTLAPVVASLGVASFGPGIVASLGKHITRKNLALYGGGIGLLAGGTYLSGQSGTEAIGNSVVYGISGGLIGKGIGAGIGGTIGSLIGGPPGTVIGAKIGTFAGPAIGALGGAYLGYNQGSSTSEIKEIMKEIEDETQRVLRSPEDKQLERTAGLANLVATRLGQLPQNQRRDLVYSLGKQEDLINEAHQKYAEQTAKTNQPNGFIRDSLNSARQEIANTLGVYDRQFNSETNQEIAKIKRANDIRDRQNQAIVRATSQIEKEARESVRTLDSLKTDRTIQQLSLVNSGVFGDIFNRNVSQLSATKFSEVLQRPESRLFGDVISTIGYKGERLSQLQQVSTLAKSLPEILRGASDRSGDNVSTYIQDELQKSNISGEIATWIDRELEGVDLSVGAEQSAYTIIDKLKSAIIGPLSRVQSEMEASSDEIVGAFRQYREQQQAVLNERMTLEVLRANAQSSNLMLSSPFTNNAVGLASIKAQMFANQQSLLTPNGLNPDMLDRQARSLEKEIRNRREQLTATPAGDLFNSRAKELQVFIEQLNNVNLALKNLAGTTVLSERAMAELEKLNSSSNARVSGRQSFLESDLQGRFEMIQQASMFGEAIRRGSFGFEDIQHPLMRIIAQQQAVKGAGLYGQQIVPGTGQTGDELRRQLIDNTNGFPAFLNATQSELDRRAQLNAEVRQTNDIYIRAQELATEGMLRASSMFLKGAELLGAQGNPLNKAGGGFARGSDTIPAMLSPGEYVVRADSARKNRATLDHINFGGAVYKAGGGQLNGSQQMARDIRIIAGKAYRYVNGKLEPVRELAGELQSGASLAGKDARSSAGMFGQALLGGFKLTYNDVMNAPLFPDKTSRPGLSQALLDGATGLFDPYKHDTLYKQDEHEHKMRHDNAYYYRNTGRVRIPSPYGNKMEHTPAELAYLEKYKKNFEAQQKKYDAEEKQAYRDKYRWDWGPQTMWALDRPVANADALIGNIGDDLESKRMKAKTASGLSKVWGFQDKLNEIQTSGEAVQARAQKEADYRDYLAANRASRGRRRSDALAGRRSAVEQNVANRRSARRDRLGLPYYTDAERNRTGQNAVPMPVGFTQPRSTSSSAPSFPDPVRQQEVSRQQSQRDNATYTTGSDCCETKEKLAVALLRFCDVSPKLTESLNRHSDVVENMPTEITHQGNHDVHVAFTGLANGSDAIMKALEPFVADMIRKQLGTTSVSSSSPLQRMTGKG